MLGALCPIHRGLSSVLAKLLYASCFALLLLGGGVLLAEDSTVHGSVRVVHRSASESDSGEVVIWLTPLQSGGSAGPGPMARLLQKNKKFVPHVLAVTRGTQIEFPNEDLFFHSVTLVCMRAGQPVKSASVNPASPTFSARFTRK